MTDRDTFAAAAMTGIITTECGYELEHFAKMCYEHADAMLRERERNGAVAGCETVRLTDAEREAIECFARMKWNTNGIEYHAATLRTLLEKLT